MGGCCQLDSLRGLGVKDVQELRVSESTVRYQVMSTIVNWLVSLCCLNSALCFFLLFLFCEVIISTIYIFRKKINF